MKKLKQTMSGAEQKKCVLDWKQENEVILNDALGFGNGPQYRFLAGILFAPSSSKVIVPHLQDVIQADGEHTSFGKYTLLSAYGTTAKGNMSPLAFGIMFGNEDTGNWTKFWEFVKEIHPSVNAPTTTILTDQDKGSIAAISATLPEAHQFHCSTYVSVRHGQRRKRKDAQRRTSASRVSWITLKNQQRRSGRGE